MIKNLTAIIVYTLFSISCNSQVPGRKQAEKLNLEAVNIATQNDSNIDSIRKSIALLDRAIKVDKTYKTAYSNELSYLCQLGERERALQTVNQIIDFGTMLGDWKLMKGHILERMDRHDEADQAYREALTEFEKDINTKPNDVKSQLGKAQVMLFLRGKDAGIMEYNKIKEQYPDNKLVLNMRQEFYDFNKGKVLSSFCK